MGIDVAKYPEKKYCNNCGIIHDYNNRCGALSPGYDFKQGVGFCPHCKNRYRGDTTEPVEVYVPWEGSRLVWTSCWACFIRKLEG